MTIVKEEFISIGNKVKIIGSDKLFIITKIEGDKYTLDNKDIFSRNDLIPIIQKFKIGEYIKSYGLIHRIDDAVVIRGSEKVLYSIGMLIYFKPNYGDGVTFEKLDFRELLKNHIGNKFYCSLLRKYLVLEKISDRLYFKEPITEKIISVNHQCSIDEEAECCIFPDHKYLNWLEWEDRLLPNHS